ncbi:peptide deformylase [Pradoshia sp. D12]|uniref:peptide deformylase n=1 Tax=Bacillaceae TaxID=186817 RepID=UPI00080AC52B|nr:MULTISPECIES: peptide deformylase [Bacillaceae]OCA89676.1 peptide deformylase [Bacillus sp. FJAT-27986]QFK70929.1 peptide deformylase [Pradoshia sp. D12]TPF72721.1 peptide deformylase [Bacillus sp. D12]
MAVLPIVKHPDKILETPCKKVEVFDRKLAKLLDDMYDTMIDADGVGLAAPQIGKNIRVAIVDVDDESGTFELINPTILSTKGKDRDVEGCLSFPNLYGEVERPAYVKIQAQDRQGRTYILEAEDYLARAIQHEMDHLEGILFTSKVVRYISEEELEGYEVE